MAIQPQQFGSDETIRLSCRNGEAVMWLAIKSPIACDKWDILDFWEMNDGDYVTVTNRVVDLPVYFDLHPTEAFGSEAYAMQERLDSGWQPGDPVEGPNLWRVKAGDRLVWVDSRLRSDPVKGVLVFQECALAYGESVQPTQESLMSYGSRTGEPSPELVQACHAAFRFAAELGPARCWAPDWGLGA